MTLQKIFNTLEVMAQDVTPVAAARIAAAVVYKGDVISFGINEQKSDPFQAKYSKNALAIYRHAETSAIKKALKRLTPEELSRSTLHVCRVKYNRKGKFIRGLARPCEGCQKAITKFNINNVYFSCDGPEIKRL